MIYCMSDIYGDYERYKKMLVKIRFSDKDILYVLGNSIDGGDSMKILLDMMMRENVYPVIGEHEYAALRCLGKLMEASDMSDLSSLDPDTMQKLSDWVRIGGQKTIVQFRALSDEQKEMVVDYLCDFALYEEVSAGGKDFILVHAGLSNFAPEKDLDDYDIYELITGSLDYSKVYFEDKYLVTGHTPTRKIHEEDNPLLEPAVNGAPCGHDKIFIKNNHIAINCGDDIGGRLGAIRLDDMAEFYVD